MLPDLIRRWFGRGNETNRPGILLVDDFLPDNRIGAGAPQLVALLGALRRANADVTYWPASETDFGLPDQSGIAAHGATIIGQGDRGSLADFLNARAGTFDGIILSRPHNMAAFNEIVENDPQAFGAARIVYNAEALFAERRILRRQLIGKPMKGAVAESHIAREVALADTAETVLAINGSTAREFAERGHRDVRVLGHAVAIRPTPEPFASRKGLLFVGPTVNEKTPNTDSIVWFVDHVLPILRRSLGPDLRLKLVGNAKAEAVHARSEGLDIMGVVPDLTEVYRQARVFVAPTRFGAGVPLKVVDAAAHGVPIVLTSMLAGQLGWSHDNEVLVADSAEDFADACLRLHHDQDLWNRIRNNALTSVERDFGLPRFDRVVARVVADIAGR